MVSPRNNIWRLTKQPTQEDVSHRRERVNNLRQKKSRPQEMFHIEYIPMDGPETRLAEIREQKGVTQAELARRVGLSRGQIANLEKGTRTFSLYDLRRVARALDVSVGELLFPDDVPNQPSEDDLGILRAFDQLDGTDRALAANIAADLVGMVRHMAVRGALAGTRDEAQRLTSTWNGLSEERRRWALNVLEGAR